jgi:hypothetical protein
MTTSTRLSLAVPIVALAVSAGLLAQAPSKPLSAAEVSQLISKGDPIDHARLSAHFSALAERQAADVKLHTAMQQAYANSGKPSGLGMVNHCKAMVGRAQESAGSLKEVAAYHSKLAGGTTVTSGLAVLEPATGRPSDAELARLAATAETAADHRALQTYFTSVATRDEREAADHAAYAKTWRGLTKVTAYQTQAAAHDRTADQLRAAAKEARAAAASAPCIAAKAK